MNIRLTSIKTLGPHFLQYQSTLSIVALSIFNYVFQLRTAYMSAWHLRVQRRSYFGKFLQS